MVKVTHTNWNALCLSPYDGYHNEICCHKGKGDCCHCYKQMIYDIEDVIMTLTIILFIIIGVIFYL